MASRQPSASGARSRELAILKAIAEALNGASNVEEALQTTLKQVAALLGLRTGWIWLTDPRTGRFYSAVAQRLPPFLLEPVRMTGGTCWCLDAFRAGALRAGNIDVMECSRLRAAVAARDRARTRGLRYHASIPLYFGDRRLGIMNVAGPAWRKLTPRELDLLSTIASQVGVAIERARLAGESVQVARMEERTRLAREIHDTIAQRLTAIGLHIEAALDALRKEEAAPAIGGALGPAVDQLRRALALSQSSVDDARGSMRQLRASAGRPLPEALDALARAFTAETGIRVHVRVAAAPEAAQHGANGLRPRVLASAADDDLLRMVGEALTNVRKHAHATDVEVSIAEDAGTLRLEIADNGRGFNPRARTTGFGLVGLRERAEALGGDLRIASRPRHGTRLTLTIAPAPATARSRDNEDDIEPRGGPSSRAAGRSARRGGGVNTVESRDSSPRAIGRRGVRGRRS